MKAWLVGMMLLQVVGTGPRAEPSHLKYVREVDVPAGAVGTVCAVLDGAVFAHAAGRSAEDLRVFAQGGAAEVETPFALTENGPGSVETEPARVLNAGVRDGAVVFDLAMPGRAYSEVDLGVALKDFVATAEVSGSQVDGSGARELGTFTVFDLSGQRLARSTALPLEEATLPVLHVAMRFRTPGGKAMEVKAGVVTGAEIPPSREAQTLYTVVAETSDLRVDGKDTVGQMVVPAHVPVERVGVVLDPAYTGNFVRAVSVEAAARGGEKDSLAGEISREEMKVPGVDAAPIKQERMGVDAVLAANLRAAAEVTVRIANGDDAPLPVKAVQLAMRQRKVCFAAVAGKRYVLRYGDAALRAPVYDFGRVFDASSAAVEAGLGPEQGNAGFVAREDLRPYTERHPELVWVALFAVVAVLGATAMASVRKQG